MRCNDCNTILGVEYGTFECNICNSSNWYYTDNTAIGTNSGCDVVSVRCRNCHTDGHISVTYQLCNSCEDNKI